MAVTAYQNQQVRTMGIRARARAWYAWLSAFSPACMSTMKLVLGGLGAGLGERACTAANLS